MAVLLTISETVAGAELSDSLGGGGTGLDLGQVVNGGYAPLIDQSANTGWQDLFIRHDAVVDPISDVGFYLGTFSQTYGGASSSAADYASVLAMGANDTGSTKNNTDGLSRGLRIDMDWQVNAANAFDYARETTGQLRIFGKTYSGKDGSIQSKAFVLHQDAMSYWNGSTEVDATTPVAGSIGKSTDTVRGNRGHFKMRIALNTAATDGGVFQVDMKTLYSYTA